MAGFDSIYSWYGSSRPEFRAAVRDLPFTFFPALPADSTTHAVDFYMRQVGGPEAGVPAIATSVSTRGEYAAIQPFSGSVRKNWPLESFQQLAAALPLPVQWAAGPDEVLPGALRMPDLSEVAEWLAGARVYAGNDSGISHLAAAVGTPSVVVFRCTEPSVWAPRGRAAVCILRGEPEVEEVRRAVLELIR